MNNEMNAIINTMIQLCGSNTSDNVTYRQIEEQLEKKEGYVFMYFDHKADLISACVEAVADNMVEEMAAALSGSGSVITRFLKSDNIMKAAIDLISRLQSGADRNLEEASYITANRTEAYKKLASSLASFINDGNAQGIFNTTNPQEKGALIAFGLLGLRSCCNNEMKKRAAFYSSMESILGTDLKTYLKIAA